MAIDDFYCKDPLAFNIKVIGGVQQSRRNLKKEKGKKLVGVHFKAVLSVILSIY